MPLERLQKIMAAAGIASRRKSEELITAGRVSVNGQIVNELGAKADADHDHIRVDGKLLQSQEAAENLGDSGLIELTAYDIKVVALGDDGAIVSYDAIVREKPEEDQGPPPRYQHFSSVWLKQGDQWKLKFHQATAAHWGDW